MPIVAKQEVASFIQRQPCMLRDAQGSTDYGTKSAVQQTGDTTEQTLCSSLLLDLFGDIWCRCAVQLQVLERDSPLRLPTHIQRPRREVCLSVPRLQHHIAILRAITAQTVTCHTKNVPHVLLCTL